MTETSFPVMVALIADSNVRMDVNFAFISYVYNVKLAFQCRPQTVALQNL